MYKYISPQISIRKKFSFIASNTALLHIIVQYGTIKLFRSNKNCINFSYPIRRLLSVRRYGRKFGTEFVARKAKCGCRRRCVEAKHFEENDFWRGMNCLNLFVFILFFVSSKHPGKALSISYDLNGIDSKIFQTKTFGF